VTLGFQIGKRGMKKNWILAFSTPDLAIEHHGIIKYVSKYQFALFSERFREIQDFFFMSAIKLDSSENHEIVEHFIAFSTGNQIEITNNNVFSLTKLSIEWKVESLKNRCSSFLDERNNIQNEINELTKFNNPEFDSFLIQRIAEQIDKAIMCPLFVSLEFPMLISIITHPNRKIRNHSLFFEFIIKLLEKYSHAAFVLLYSIDIRWLSLDELIRFFVIVKALKNGENVGISILDKLAQMNSEMESYKEKLQQIESIDFSSQLISIDQQMTDIISLLGNNINRCRKALQENCGLKNKIDKKIRRIADVVVEPLIDLENQIKKIDKSCNSKIGMLNRALKSFETTQESIVYEQREIQKIMNSVVYKQKNIDNTL